jgi:TatD DNase family protein
MSGPVWFDSHCHIQDIYRPDETDVDGLLAVADAAGVRGLVCVGTDAGSSRQAIELARRAGGGDDGRDAAPGIGVWATIGVHPHDAIQGTEVVARLLEECAADLPGAVVAVGECGLDYHYDHSPRSVQREAWAAQIELARRQGLTLVVHSREAWDDTVALLRGTEDLGVVLHCFTGGPDEARRCLDLGAHLSFSGIVTFPNADDVRAAARLCPSDRLLVETDAPFLAPVPHRGRPNQPAWVSLVGAAVAEARGEPVEDVAERTTANARRLFSLA